MRKGVVAMEVMELAFQHGFGWEREDEFIVNHPLLPESKQTSKQKGEDPSTNPWEPVQEPSAHSLMVFHSSWKGGGRKLCA